MYRLKNVLICALCGLIITALCVAGFVMPDNAASRAERRKLEQLPELSWQTLSDSEFSGEFEKYMLDQFPLRDWFLQLNWWMRRNVLGARDVDGAYSVGDGAYLMDYPLDEKQARYAAKKLSAVYEKYLRETDTYFAMIPDKNYFVAEQNGYPHIDYGALKDIARTEFAQAQYIDLLGALEIGDYYRTDPHWSQPYIGGAVDALMAGMGREYRFDSARYEINELYPFYGAYYARTGMNIAPDTLKYLTSGSIEQAKVTLIDGQGNIYAVSRFDGMDGYDVFLHGAQAIVTIENSAAATRDELVIFRDSFGSSIAPLLIDEYAKITLVDLRYIAPELIGQYVNFDSASEALFLFSTTLINGGGVLR